MSDTPRVRLVPEAGETAGIRHESSGLPHRACVRDSGPRSGEMTGGQGHDAPAGGWAAERPNLHAIRGAAGKPAEDTAALSLPEAAYTEGQTVAQAVYLSGLFRPPALCSGLARCGRCRMRFLPPPGAPLPAPCEADRLLFTPEELASGMRLACRHVPVPGLVLELPPDTLPFALQSPGTPARTVSSGADNASARAQSAGPAPTRLLLAVDLGTTSLQWRLSAQNNSASHGLRAEVLWESGTINPQMGAGSDVVSRIAASLRPGGRERLRDLTLAALRAIAEEAARVGASDAPGLVCLAANPAMTAIALGLDTSGLAAAPLSLPFAGGAFAALPDLPPVWIPPQLSPFVGGDVSAGYASLALNQEAPPPEYPFLLADMGTNGEFLLALAPDKALAASVALGPALEGIGLTHGTDARPGAVTDATPAPSGLALTLLPEPPGRPGPAASFSGPTASFSGPAVAPVAGITGAGYLALLDALLRVNAMDRHGHFTPGSRFAAPERDPVSGEERVPLPFGLALYASDVEEALKVKAAFSLGLRRLLDAAGLDSTALRRVYLAGALGLHAKTSALNNLGFFPPGMESRIIAVGNSSLDGASLLAASKDARDALVRWAACVSPLDLAADPAFAAGFASHMRFTW